MWEEDEDGMLTASRLKKKLKEESGRDISVTKLRQIMRCDLGLRFRKVKPLAPQTNRLKSIVTRQHYAM